jgi:hypothetical protein
MGKTMKQSMAIRMLRSNIQASLAFASLTVATLALSPDAMAVVDDTKPAATVSVYAQHSGGKIIYHYRVYNNSQQNIAAVTIGRNNKNDSNPNNDVNELLELPSGWHPKLGIPAASASSPTGWHVSMIAPDENETHAIAWETINDRSPKILTGQTVNKMSVSLEMPDSNYMTGHALVTFADETALTVPLERLDFTPPSLTVNLSPNTIYSQSNKLVAISASFTIKDDYDHLPEVRLESIAANEPLEADDIRDASIGLDDRYLKFRATSKSSSGRIYTVTYSATDASGNKTVASATVTVSTSAPVTKPIAGSHDQGEKKKSEIKNQ